MLEKNNTLTQFQFLDCESKISHPQVEKKKKKQNRINPTKKTINQRTWLNNLQVDNIFSDSAKSLHAI